MVIEVFFISHGESDMNLRPDLVAGRCPGAGLTPNGKRQARALAVFLNSQGIRFNAVYSSPLDRARATAASVCQELNFAEEQIQPSDALVEMSQGHWEGCPRSEIYTPEMLSLMERFQPDFSAPSGESLRQVEFRMVQFLNATVLGLPEKIFTQLTHFCQLRLTRKKSGKSRLQFVTTTGDHDAEDEISPGEANQSSLHEINVRSSSSCISSSVGVFTHSGPIKCLLTGILGCSPEMSHKFCIEDSSVTVLQHSWKTGWQIKRLNDTAHLRLLYDLKESFLQKGSTKCSVRMISSYFKSQTEEIPMLSSFYLFILYLYFFAGITQRSLLSAGDRKISSPAVLPYVGSPPNISSFFPSTRPSSSAASPNAGAFAPVPYSGEFVGKSCSSSVEFNTGVAVFGLGFCFLFVMRLFEIDRSLHVWSGLRKQNFPAQVMIKSAW
ncbi:unnamed protein product, partial [Vitis vinifera]